MGMTRPSRRLVSVCAWRGIGNLSDTGVRSLPEHVAGPPRPFGEGLELGPGDRRMHPRLRAGNRAEAAIGAGHHVFTADHLRVADNPLGDEVWVLDKIRDRVDDAGDEHLALRQAVVLEHA